MDTTQALALLGGLSAQQFMKRNWQKKPLLVRQAIACFQPILSRPDLFARHIVLNDQLSDRVIEIAFVVTDVRLEVVGSEWSGIGQGWGHLSAGRLTVECSGRRGAARPRRVQVDLPGGPP
jgi:hypothetical protein